MTMGNVFVEQRILGAIRGLLTGRVNELLREVEFAIPIIEFDGYGCGYAAEPTIELSSCELTEKERIIRREAYTLAVTFSVSEMPESDLHCYAYSAAIGKALEEDPTLGGVAEKVTVTSKKYHQPKKPGCGEGWGLSLVLRVTVEGMRE